MRQGSRGSWTLAVLLLPGCGDESSRESRRLQEPPAARLSVSPLPDTPQERRASLEREIQALSEIGSARRGYDDGWIGTPGGLPWNSLPDADASPESSHLRLVQAGAEAIPLLLAHLEDPTPTNLVFDRRDMDIGALWRSANLPYSPRDPIERRAVKDAIPGEELASERAGTASGDPHQGSYLKEHRLRVGDVCFAILGDITNRPYAAVLGVPTMNLVVMSPVLDPRIAVAVRAMWQGRDARQALAARLAADAEARADDGFHARIAVGAAARLAYYFPQEAARFLATRLDALVPAGAHPGDAALDEEVAGETLTVLAAVESRIVRDAVIRALRRVPRAGHVLSAALQLGGRPEQALAARWTRTIKAAEFAALPGSPPLIDDTRAAADLFAAAAPDILLEAARAAKPRPWQEVLRLVDQLEPDLRLAFLRPLLQIGDFWSDEPATVGGETPKPLRVCDRAAMRIAVLRPDLPFDSTARHGARDQRIKEIAAILGDG